MIIENLAVLWIKLFEKRPVLTAILSLVVAITTTLGIFLVDQADKGRRETDRLKNLNYQTQIKQLNDTENNIRQLLTFIETQKNSLRETEDTITSLQKEREKLKPIVESDRAIVEAIFRAQEERNHANIWQERWIGFAFGIGASVIASFIWFVISMLLKRRHDKSLQPTANTTGNSPG